MHSTSVEAAVAWLHDRIAHDPTIGPELFAQLRQAQLDRGLRHDARPIGSFLRPLILSRSRYQTVAQAAETLAAAFERLAAAALADETLLSELSLTERETALARINPGYRRLCVTSRLDAYLSATGFKFLEYNGESPAGMVDQLLLEEIFFDLPYMREFLSIFPVWHPRPHERLLAALHTAYRDWGGDAPYPQIAIIDWKGVSTESEFHALKDYFEAEGYPTIVADPHDLKYGAGVLSVHGFPIDILYKRVIIHEFLEKFDDPHHPLLQAYRDGAVCLANSFRSKIVHKKAGFAILSDPTYEHLFTPEQVATIRRHIPWTRVLRAGATTAFDGAAYDMERLLAGAREHLVLKPNDDYGGHGVIIGRETPPAEWEEVCRQTLAAGRPYVVQELVPVRKELMPVFADHLAWEEMTIDFDPFLFLNQVEGGIVRLSSSSLSNVSSGAGVTALLVLEDN